MRRRCRTDRTVDPDVPEAVAVPIAVAITQQIAPHSPVTAVPAAQWQAAVHDLALRPGELEHPLCGVPITVLVDERERTLPGLGDARHDVDLDRLVGP